MNNFSATSSHRGGQWFGPTIAHRTVLCANRGLAAGWAGLAGDGGSGLRDFEHGDESFRCDADLADERFDGGLALGGRTGVDDPAQVAGEVADHRWRGGLRLAGDGGGECVAAGGELGDLVVEFAEPGPGGGVVHGAVLEPRVVAVDRGLLGADLGVHGVQFGLPRGAVAGVAGTWSRGRARPTRPDRRDAAGREWRRWSAPAPAASRRWRPRSATVAAQRHSWYRGRGRSGRRRTSSRQSCARGAGSVPGRAAGRRAPRPATCARRGLRRRAARRRPGRAGSATARSQSRGAAGTGAAPRSARALPAGTTLYGTPSAERLAAAAASDGVCASVRGQRRPSGRRRRCSRPKP